MTFLANYHLYVIELMGYRSGDSQREEYRVVPGSRY
jgi:hypothetical protein